MKNISLILLVCLITFPITALTEEYPTPCNIKLAQCEAIVRAQKDNHYYKEWLKLVPKYIKQEKKIRRLRRRLKHCRRK